MQILGGFSDSQLEKYSQGEIVSAEYFKSIFHSPYNFSMMAVK